MSNYMEATKYFACLPPSRGAVIIVMFYPLHLGEGDRVVPSHAAHCLAVASLWNLKQNCHKGAAQCSFLQQCQKASCPWSHHVHVLPAGLEN